MRHFESEIDNNNTCTTYKPKKIFERRYTEYKSEKDKLSMKEYLGKIRPNT